MAGPTTIPSLPDLPGHLAIIMDGNGRWATRRGLPRSHAHRAGARNLLRVVEACQAAEIPCLTVYAFSTENWGRPSDEVKTILSLPDLFIKEALPRFQAWGVRLRHVGFKDRLAPAMVRRLRDAEARTGANRRLALNVAFDYGGRHEIVHVVKSVLAAGVPPEAVGPELIEGHLFTAGLPDPDLVVRISGEIRSSNFLLWQTSRSWWFFSPKMWPDFGPEDLQAAPGAYERRLTGP